MEAFKKELQDQINSINVKNEKFEKVKILEGKIDKLTMDQIDLKYRIDVLEKQKSLEKLEKNAEKLVKEESEQNQIEFFNIPHREISAPFLSIENFILYFLCVDELTFETKVIT